MAVCLRDPCGLFCLLLTYLSLAYSEYVILRHILLEDYAGSVWCPIHAVLYNVIVFLLLTSHTRAVLSDPGVVPLPEMAIDFSDLRGAPRKNDRGNEDWTLCNRCETYRPPRAHHCRICLRCIRRMDHHCPWINNCVGELNQKYFIQFLFYTALASLYAMGLVLGTWLLPALRGGNGEDAEKTGHVRSHVQITHCILLLVESVLFGLFVAVVFHDQIVSIITDETPIEQLRNRLLKEARKEVPASRKPKMALLREVFGRGLIICWFCPLVTSPSPRDPAYTYLPDYDV